MTIYPTHKICTKCHQTKSLEEFNKSKKTKDGKTYWCKTCVTNNHLARLEQIPGMKDKKKQYHADWAKLTASKQWLKEWRVKKIYGLTKQMYDDILLKQNFRCKICKRHESEFKKRLFVDHCHETGQIRGLLCFECNILLGKAKDSVEILKEAIEYLCLPIP